VDDSATITENMHLKKFEVKTSFLRKTHGRTQTCTAEYLCPTEDMSHYAEMFLAWLHVPVTATE